MLDEARAHMKRGVRNVLIQGATGIGKTALTAHMFMTASSRGRICAFGVHRAELIRQAAATFDRVGIRYGIVSPNHPMDTSARVQICSIDTWRNRVSRLPRFDFIAWDEAHHTAAATWAKLHEAYPDAYHVGLTATPQRLDGRGLRDYFSELVCGPSMRWLIDEGWLSPYRYFDAGEEQDEKKLFGDIVRNYLQIACGKRAIYFCRTVQHSIDTAAAFRERGIPAAHVDANTPADERLLTMRRFEAGEIIVLTNAALFSEGVDVPGVEVVGLARKSESLTWYLQCVGRGLRPVYSPGLSLNTARERKLAIAAGPKPSAIILDHAGLRRLHGRPCDDRIWTLDGCVSSEAGGSAGRRCPQCFAMNKVASDRCSECGYKWPKGSRKEPGVVDGDLREAEDDLMAGEAAAAMSKARAEKLRAQTVLGLIELGRMRGYKDPTGWAMGIEAARKKRKVSTRRA